MFNTDKDWKERGFNLRQPPLVLVAYDPAGDGADHDALVMVAREEHQRGEPYDPDFAVLMAFRVLMAYRMPQGIEFPDKLAMLLNIHRRLRQWAAWGRASTHAFCVETNGVGHAMGSTLRQKIGTHVVPYTTVGTSSGIPVEGKKLTMPRLAALDNMRVLAETHVLKVAKDAPGRAHLTQEMSAFVWRAPGRPEAMQGQRDDLVMATAGACWIGTKVIPPQLKAERYKAKTH